MNNEAFESWFLGVYQARGFVSSKSELQEAWNAALAAKQTTLQEMIDTTGKNCAERLARKIPEPVAEGGLIE